MTCIIVLRSKGFFRLSPSQQIEGWLHHQLSLYTHLPSKIYILPQTNKLLSTEYFLAVTHYSHEKMFKIRLRVVFESLNFHADPLGVVKNESNVIFQHKEKCHGKRIARVSLNICGHFWPLKIFIMLKCSRKAIANIIIAWLRKEFTLNIIQNASQERWPKARR
jgi:hypothetical protein